jgi:hypothetical protein
MNERPNQIYPGAPFIRRMMDQMRPISKMGGYQGTETLSHRDEEEGV